MTGWLPIFLQKKGGGEGGGGGHPTASDIRVRLQPESCRLAGSESESQGVGRLDSEVAWTSLSFGRCSSGRSRANLIGSSRRS
jgi:hypothetical protein